ncbi:MAG: hypothetical protein ACOVQS_05300 [Chitinophagaceae bacterium]|jgi:hypothetical protein
MKDPLKTFIEQHRDDFDTEIPPASLFDRTASGLRNANANHPRLRIPVRTGMAAAACILAFVSYLAIRNTATTTDPEMASVPARGEIQIQADPLLQRIDSGSAREMQLMAREANQRESGLVLLRKDDPELYQRFLSDLAELDSVYNSLREMLTRTPNHQQLIEAMEINLQMRLQLLERQNMVIQDIKRNKKPRS